MDRLTVTALKQKQRRPIKYWSAWQFGKEIDQNNSIALLRHKYGANAIYKAVR